MGETYALIPAAGHGARFRKSGLPPGEAATSEGGGPPSSKLLAILAGRPVLAHTLRAFERCEEIDGIVLAGNETDFPAFRTLAQAAGITKPLLLAEGGATRQDSVYRALAALPPTVEIVAIHDAARPLVTAEVILRTIQAAREHGAALATVPVVDTIKQVEADGRITGTLPRASLRAAQTPQTFSVSLIREAHELARQEGINATDDSALVEWIGIPVRCVDGDRRNLKITTPEDLLLAEALMPPESPSLPEIPGSHYSPSLDYPRVGFGYDIHRLAEGRKLVLGGVEIPHPLGLDGHSDADVLLHALMDALLGAVGLPDIGHYFPNTAAQWKGVSSRVLLREVAQILRKEGYCPLNVDVTLIAERPKIADYRSAMREGIAADLGLDVSAVGIKATTNETVGAIGREEAMAAHAVASVVKA